MYAVIRTGGKQYRVTSGDIISVEKLAGEADETITFDDVLLIGDEKSQTVGAPVVDGASVVGTIMQQARGDKIIVFKKKRRKGYRRTKGHRQLETVVKITDVLAKGKKPAAKKAAAKKAEPAAEAPADEAAPAKAEAKPKAAAKPKAEAKPKAAAKPKAVAEKTAAAKAKPAAKKPAAKKPAAKSESKE